MNQLQQLPVNPKLNSCFGDEDFVRRCCNIDAVMHYGINHVMVLK